MFVTYKGTFIKTNQTLPEWFEPIWAKAQIPRGIHTLRDLGARALGFGRGRCAARVAARGDYPEQEEGKYLRAGPKTGVHPRQKTSEAGAPQVSQVHTARRFAHFRAK